MGYKGEAMWLTITATIALVALIMSAMAVGVMFSNKELKGSCGGVGGACACEEAGTPGACATAPSVDPDLYQPPGRVMALRRDRSGS